MMNPEPVAVLIRPLIFKGSSANAEIETTDGETRWKSSGIGSAQSELPMAGVIPIAVMIEAMRIEDRYPFMFIPPG
jgi:hypothetical protein